MVKAAIRCDKQTDFFYFSAFAMDPRPASLCIRTRRRIDLQAMGLVVSHHPQHSNVVLPCARAQTTPGTEFGVGPCGDPTGETPFAIASALQDAMLVTDRAAGVVRVFGGAPADAPRMVRAPMSPAHGVCESNA